MNISGWITEQWTHVVSKLVGRWNSTRWSTSVWYETLTQCWFDVEQRLRPWFKYWSSIWPMVLQLHKCLWVIADQGRRFVATCCQGRCQGRLLPRRCCWCEWWGGGAPCGGGDGVIGGHCWPIDERWPSFQIPHFLTVQYIFIFDMKGCICHFTKWQIHPFISKGKILLPARAECCPVKFREHFKICEVYITVGARINKPFYPLN